MSRQYRNPPLRQAVCEFRFQAESPWDLAIPGLIYAKMRDEFPKRLLTAKGVVGATFVIGPEGIQQQIDGEGVFQQHIAQQAGLRFSTEDETGVIRVGPNLLSVSQFPPYPSWQGYLPVIRKAFGTFREIAEPKGIQRIGLRYINQVMLGEESIDLEQFFDFYPFAGERMPQDYLSFIIGVQIAFHDDRDILRLQMTTGAKDESDRVPILLDLDYFPRISGEVSFENVFDWLDEAHMHIEEVFEGCLKDTLRDRFEEVRD